MPVTSVLVASSTPLRFTLLCLTLLAVCVASMAALAATAPDRDGLRWMALDWLAGPAREQ